MGGETSAVRPRKQPYNPRSGSSKADRQAPVAFSFRGLDIRHRLPDAKRSRELLRAPGGAPCLSGFRHPRTVRIRSTSIIGHTQCLWQCAIHGRGLLPRCDCSAFSASLHSGLFLPQRDPENQVRSRAHIRKPSLAEGSALAQRKGFPNSLPRSRLCRPSLRWSSALLRMGDTPPLALCRPAFARRRSACRYMPRMA